MVNKLRILIAEDHLSVREGFRLIIESQEDMEVVGEAGDGRAAVELALQLQPDIVLMDISMPELNGLKAAAKLKRIAPDIKILTLTRHTDEAYLKELLQAGVSGYVLKQSASTELIRAIHAIAAGGNYLDPAIAGKVFAGYAGEQNKLRIAPDIKILTLTRHTDEAYLKELLQAGVSGYVLKQSASTELIRAIHAIAAGGNYLDPAIAGKVFAGYAGEQNKLRIAPDIKILTLTRHTDEAYLKELLQAGVSGYVLKQSASTELIRAIHAIAAGGNYLDPAIARKT